MDEKNEGQGEGSGTNDDAAVFDTSALMPLSMPPVTAQQPPVTNTMSGAPTPSAGVPTSETPQVGASPYDTSPMPLSMPPYVPVQSSPEHGGAGGVIPPYGAGWYAEFPPPAAAPKRRKGRTVAIAAAVALLVGGLGAGLGATFGSSNNATPNSSLQVIPNTSTKPLIGATNSESKIYKAVEPAVVDINTNVASPAGQQEKAAGTGMIVTSSGEILTNNHVVVDATSITVTVQHHSGPVNGQYKAKVIGVDPVHDVALIQIEGISNLPHVSLANSSTVAVGQTVYAIGNALGFGGAPSVQSGSITSIGRTINASDEAGNQSSETLHNLLQTDALIQSGDSGGPLVNEHGQVIGMNTAAASTDGNSTESVGFAIPINEARNIANNIANGKAVNGIVIGLSSFLGVDLSNPGTSTNNGNFNLGNGFGFSTGNSGESSPTQTVAGVPIEAVVEGSPAATAGINSGDVITKINGTAVTKVADVTNALAKLKPGTSVTVTYVDTNDASHTATVKLAGIPR